MQNISGVFNSEKDVKNTINELIDKGFSKKNISVIYDAKQKKANYSFFRNGITPFQGALEGAVIGTVAGTLITFFTTAGNQNLFKYGINFDSNLTPVLNGALLSAILGGLFGALVIKIFSVNAQKRYETTLNSGKSLIAVHVSEIEDERQVRRIMLSNSAILSAA